jgi:hypothetical protein
MSRTLQDFITEVQPLIRDTSGNTVTNEDIRLSANRGLRHLQQRYGISATKSRSSLKVYPNVQEYPAPSDFHDWVVLQDRGNPIDFDRLSPSDFWRSLNTRRNTVSTDTVLGDRFLLVNYAGAGNSVQMHALNSLTDNGTWSADATTDALNIRQDKLIKKHGQASVAFDVDVSQSANNYAAIVNTTVSSTDLSDYEDVGAAFVWVYIPDVTYMTSVTLRWGSSSSAYWEGTETTDYNGNSFRNGWNRVGTEWESSTETGSPDSEAVDYLYVRVTYSASQTDDTGFRVDRFLVENPSALELSYTSRYFVKSSGGTLQESFSAVSDYTLLEDQEADLLFWWVLQDAHLIKEQSGELDIARAQFERAVADWQLRHGSERKRPTYQYAHLTRRGLRRRSRIY